MDFKIFFWLFLLISTAHANRPSVEEGVEDCPCILRDHCPRVYDEKVDAGELGNWKDCVEHGWVRCCGVDVTTVIEGTQQDHATAESSYQPKRYLPKISSSEEEAAPVKSLTKLRPSFRRTIGTTSTTPTPTEKAGPRLAPYVPKIRPFVSTPKKDDQQIQNLAGGEEVADPLPRRRPSLRRRVRPEYTKVEEQQPEVSEQPEQVAAPQRVVFTEVEERVRRPPVVVRRRVRVNGTTSTTTTEGPTEMPELVTTSTTTTTTTEKPTTTTTSTTQKPYVTIHRTVATSPPQVHTYSTYGNGKPEVASPQPQPFSHSHRFSVPPKFSFNFGFSGVPSMEEEEPVLQQTPKHQQRHQVDQQTPVPIEKKEPVQIMPKQRIRPTIPHRQPVPLTFDSKKYQQHSTSTTSTTTTSTTTTTPTPYKEEEEDEEDYYPSHGTYPEEEEEEEEPYPQPKYQEPHPHHQPKYQNSIPSYSKPYTSDWIPLPESYWEDESRVREQRVEKQQPRIQRVKFMKQQEVHQPEVQEEVEKKSPSSSSYTFPAYRKSTKVVEERPQEEDRYAAVAAPVEKPVMIVEAVPEVKPTRPAMVLPTPQRHFSSTPTQKPNSRFGTALLRSTTTMSPRLVPGRFSNKEEGLVQPKIKVPSTFAAEERPKVESSRFKAAKFPPPPPTEEPKRQPQVKQEAAYQVRPAAPVFQQHQGPTHYEHLYEGQPVIPQHTEVSFGTGEEFKEVHQPGSGMVYQQQQQFHPEQINHYQHQQQNNYQQIHEPQQQIPQTQLRENLPQPNLPVQEANRPLPLPPQYVPPVFESRFPVQPPQQELLPQRSQDPQNAPNSPQQPSHHHNVVSQTRFPVQQIPQQHFHPQQVRQEEHHPPPPQVGTTQFLIENGELIEDNRDRFVHLNRGPQQQQPQQQRIHPQDQVSYKLQNNHHPQNLDFIVKNREHDQHRNLGHKLDFDQQAQLAKLHLSQNQEPQQFDHKLTTAVELKTRQEHEFNIQKERAAFQEREGPRRRPNMEQEEEEGHGQHRLEDMINVKFDFDHHQQQPYHHVEQQKKEVVNQEEMFNGKYDYGQEQQQQYQTIPQRERTPPGHVLLQNGNFHHGQRFEDPNNAKTFTNPRGQLAPNYLSHQQKILPKSTRQGRSVSVEGSAFQPPALVQRGFYPILPYSEEDPGILVL